METQDLIAVGEVIKAQGIRGEVKVVPLTDDPKRFGEIRRVFWNEPSGWRELQIESYRPFNELVLLKFAGINDMNAANLLGRGLIYIPRTERPELPQGRYYYDQIEGLKVHTINGEYLGVIEEILETGSNDVYSVINSGKQILIPALKTVIKEIDLRQGKMIVQLPPGLVEDTD